MYRLKVIRENIPGDSELEANSAKTVYEKYKDEYEAYDRERLEVLHLNTLNEVMARETISIGSLSASIVCAREVFKGALLNNSAAIILMHNHPSGSPAPSSDDKKITRELQQAAKLFDIKILDHIIFGKANYYSFKEENIL